MKVNVKSQKASDQKIADPRPVTDLKEYLMLGHLIRKEILDHISGLRFLILSGIGAMVIWLSLFSGYTYYQDRLRDYRAAQKATEETVRRFPDANKLEPYSTFMELMRNLPYMIHKPPTPMCIFVRGLEPGLGRSTSDARSLALSPAAVEPKLGIFPPLDLGLVVQVLLSLFVLLFTYDAVCGEKELGTLRMTGAFSVPKDRLLLGKFFGALIPTLSAFGLPLILGIAAVIAMPDVQFTPPELMRLGFILIAFGFYLTAFLCVGILSSSVTHRAATSFVILLAFWVGSVVVLPRLSLIAAEGIRPAPSVHEYQAEKARISRERLEKHRELRREWGEAHPNAWETPEGREAYRFYFREARDVSHQFVAEQMTRLEETFRNRYNARLTLAVALARVSPAFALKNVTVRLAGTGLNRHRRFESALERHLKGDGEWYRQASLEYYLQYAHPEKYGEPTWDVSDRPRFTYRKVWPQGEVQESMVDVGILIVWGLVCFVGAYVAMLRYDVR